MEQRSLNFWQPIEVAFSADIVTILPGIGHQTNTPDTTSHPEEFIRKQSYFIITFRVQEFLKFIYSDTEVYKHYQLTKIVQFLKGLQTIEPLVTYFKEE